MFVAQTLTEQRYELIAKEIRSDALRRFVAEQAKAHPGKNGGGLERGDLIRPTGALLKFVHCDHPDDKTGPKFEASFEVNQVGFCSRIMFSNISQVSSFPLQPCVWADFSFMLCQMVAR